MSIIFGIEKTKTKSKVDDGVTGSYSNFHTQQHKATKSIATQEAPSLPGWDTSLRQGYLHQKETGTQLSFTLVERDKVK